MTRSPWLTVGLFAAVAVVNRCAPSGPVELLGVSGASVMTIEKRFGSAERDVEFLLTKQPLEYRYGLLSKFPSPEGVRIREMTWTDGPTRRAVWFEKKQSDWVGVQGLEWHSNIQF